MLTAATDIRLLATMTQLPLVELTETWSDGFFYMKLREKFKRGKFLSVIFILCANWGKRPTLLDFIGGTCVPGSIDWE
jgi:uncharacterized RDD family membrane protein YckC